MNWPRIQQSTGIIQHGAKKATKAAETRCGRRASIGCCVFLPVEDLASKALMPAGPLRVPESIAGAKDDDEKWKSEPRILELM